MIRALGFGAILLLAAAGARADEWRGKEWPKADRLFRSDPRWLGADAAFTVPIGDDRILWLFGDTFVGDGEQTRPEARFLRTSIGIQRGLDPESATISFHWRTDNGEPSSYFPASPESWLWPLHGIHRNGALTIFFSRLMPTNTGLRFAGYGSTALRCDSTTTDPESWWFRTLGAPRAPSGLKNLLYGVAVLDSDTHVLAYCVDEESDLAYLLRWSAFDFDYGDLASPEWWNGTRFVPARELHAVPAPVFGDAATEFSVHRLPDGRYLQVQTLGFGATDIGVRYAPQPEGPWSDPQPVFRPAESRIKDVFVYAAKAHPELTGAPILVTYAANYFDPAKLLESKTLYYPRFVRLSPRTHAAD